MRGALVCEECGSGSEIELPVCEGSQIPLICEGSQERCRIWFTCPVCRMRVPTSRAAALAAIVAHTRLCHRGAG